MYYTVSILRDTLGDSDPENDRMRYLGRSLTRSRPGQAIWGVSLFYGRVLQQGG